MSNKFELKLTPDKLKRILDIIDLNHIMFGIRVIGTNVLTTEDKKMLKKFGINIKQLIQKYPNISQSFHWGRLSQILKSKASQVSEIDFFKYLSRGQYIPLNESEQYALSYVENKSYSHIKGLADRAKQTASGIIIENDPNLRTFRESAIKDAAKKTIIERESVSFMVSEIGHKTKDWERDLGRIAETELNNAFQVGRAEQIRRENGDNALVYKDIYSQACRHCVRLYTTNGVGSKPRVFTLPELMANGDNIGKKVKDWLATLGSVHPFCRCSLHKVPKDWQWDEEKKAFMPKKYDDNKYGERGTIKVTIGDKVIIV